MADLGRAIVRGVTRSAKLDASLKGLGATHTSLQQCVGKAFPQRKLYAFGSTTVMGLMEAGSDVDFVMLEAKHVANGMAPDDASQQARALQTHALGKVAGVMRQQHRLLRFEEVKRTRVPVIRCAKATPPTFPVAFDLTADRRNGVRNSWLLRQYFDQYPQARWLALAVKRWSKATQMNGQAGFLTSYAFNILVVHYYRARLGKMAFVPLESADVSKVPAVPKGLPLTKPQDLEAFGKEVEGFIEFYLREFDYDKDVVTLSRPEPTTVDKIGWTREAEDALKMQQSDGETGGRLSYRLCIEDPFEHNLNVGRNVSAFKLDMLRQHLARARETSFGFAEAEE